MIFLSNTIIPGPNDSEEEFSDSPDEEVILMSSRRSVSSRAPSNFSGFDRVEDLICDGRFRFLPG